MKEKNDSTDDWVWKGNKAVQSTEKKYFIITTNGPINTTNDAVNETKQKLVTFGLNIKQIILLSFLLFYFLVI